MVCQPPNAIANDEVPSNVLPFHARTRPSRLLSDTYPWRWLVASRTSRKLVSELPMYEKYTLARIQTSETAVGLKTNDRRWLPPCTVWKCRLYRPGERTMVDSR